MLKLRTGVCLTRLHRRSFFTYATSGCLFQDTASMFKHSHKGPFYAVFKEDASIVCSSNDKLTATYPEIQFVNKTNMLPFLSEKGVSAIMHVTIPLESKILVKSNGFWTTRVNIIKQISIAEMEEWADAEFCVKAVAHNPRLIKYVKTKNVNMCLSAYAQDSNTWNDINFRTRLWIPVFCTTYVLFGVSAVSAFCYGSFCYLDSTLSSLAKRGLI